MSLEQFYMTFVLWICLSPSLGWPLLPENSTIFLPRKLVKSSAVTPVSSEFPKQKDTKDGGGSGVQAADKDESPGPIGGLHFYRLPPSPANLLKPDGFQFYAYNERGDMITKQMTVQEIQALIAAGGPDHSNTEAQEPQKAEDILTGGKKVMDVVEKVQSVLKSAMEKPAATFGASIPSVPEKENAEWSSILPVILAGDKYGDKYGDKLEGGLVNAEVNGKPTYPSTVHIDPHAGDSLKSQTVESSAVSLELSDKPTESLERPEQTIIDDQRRDGNETHSTVVTEAASNTEKLMIPVSVITAEQKAQISQGTTQSVVVSVKPIEMLQAENEFQDDHSSHDEKRNLTGITHSAGSNDFSLSTIESTTVDHESTELASTTVVDTVSSVSERVTIRSPTTETRTEKPTEGIAMNRPQSDGAFEAKSTTVPVPVLESGSGSVSGSVSSQPETLLIDAAVTTPSPLTSFTLPTSTDIFDTVFPAASPTIIMTNDATTKPAALHSARPPLKPLSVELVNSLSSMINQVSEAVPSILPGSSAFESVKSETYPETFENDTDTEGTGTVGSVVGATKTTESTVQGSLVDATTKLETDHDETSPTESSPVSFAPTVSTLATTIDGKDRTASYISVSTNAAELMQSHVPSIQQFLTITTESTSVTKETSDAAGTDVALSTVSVNQSATNDLTQTLQDSTDKVTTATNAFTIPASSNANRTDFDSSSKAAAETDNEPHSNAESLAIIENILQSIPISSMANDALPVTEAFLLPDTLSGNVPTKTLASGLIAGFESIASNTTRHAAYETTIPEKEDSTNVTAAPSKPDTRVPTSTTPIVMGTRVKEHTQNRDEEYKGNGTEGASATATAENLSNDVSGSSSVLAIDAAKPFETNATRTPAENDEPPIASTNRTSTTPGTDPSTLGVTAEDTVKDRKNDSSVVDSPFPKRTLTPAQETTLSSSVESSTKNVPAEHATILFDRQESTAEGDTVEMKPSDEGSMVENKTVAQRPERVPQDVLKKDDSSSGSGSGSGSTIRLDGPTETTMTEDTEEKVAMANGELSNSVVASTEDAPPLERVEQQQTISNWNTVNGSKVPAKNESKVPMQSVDASNSIDSQAAGNKTSRPNEEKWRPSETKADTAKKEAEKSTGGIADSEDKWERVSTLHQTSSSHSAPPPPPPPGKPVPVSKRPEQIAESAAGNGTKAEGTRYESSSPVTEAESTVTLDPSKSISGLDSSTRNASVEIVKFSRLCNELALKFWIAANKGLSSGRSLALSPFGMISLLAMIYLGARGSTSDQMNEVLGLDNVATFNPHLIFQNVTDAVSLARQQGIANAAFVRELFADKAKVRKLMPFYKEQAQQFYEGLVSEVNFATISDLARRRTNLLIRKQTGGRIKDFVRSNAVPLRSPLAAISANVFQTDCNTSLASTKGRDGELYFAVSSAHRLRKLIPVPATVWRSNVLAGYEPSLDATAVALGGLGKLVSTIFLLPGQQGHAAPGDTLDRLEQRLFQQTPFPDGSWNKLLKVLIPRLGLELQIPKFSHRSVVNATAALKRMGLDRLFSKDADFRGINGIGNRLFLSDVLQMNLFSTCGDENLANGRHHVEIYPASPSWRNSPRERSSDCVASFDSPKSCRTVSIADKSTNDSERSQDKPRLKLDQPFLYFVRHNPTGLILHMGRFNPRLL